MVSKQSVKNQLKKLGFNYTGWGRTEVSELHNILLPDENVFELVNGYYEGGFALLVATDIRVLLVDKKPMKYLTVEDLRFDMINEMDYSHRLLGAHISIATGNKNLKFTSINQPRLRKLIGHVQHSMAEIKKKENGHQEDQKSHLEQINQQLQVYLVAQQQHQLQLQELQQAQMTGKTMAPPPEPVKPSPELSDYLYAQSLMAQYQSQTAPQPTGSMANTPAPQTDEIYAEAQKEIFGNYQISHPANNVAVAPPSSLHIPIPGIPDIPNPFDLNPLKIAISKLPMALRNKKFGRPSFHAHSASQPQSADQPIY